MRHSFEDVMSVRIRKEKKKELGNKSKFEQEITEGLSPAEAAVVLDFFNDDSNLDPTTDKKIRDLIGGIDDETAREVLVKIFSQIYGVEAEIAATKNEAISGLVDATEISAEIIRDVFSQEGAKEKDDELSHQREGRRKLNEFVLEVKQPYNLFYVDKNLSRSQLEQRCALLDELYGTFKGLNFTDKDAMEKVLVQMFDVPVITEEAQNYLDQLEALSHKDTTGDHRFSQGAENKNFIYQGKELESQVIKITKGRHDTDFTSIIKLMRDMHYLALHFNEQESDDKNVQIDATFDDMIIYRDESGNYKRLVRQKFAKGVTIKDLPREIMENDPNFRAAWKYFLRRVEMMKEQFGLVLDISDSAAGFKKQRGNVANTGNVFVALPTEPGEVYKFSIVDPDMFDTVEGEHKFDAAEHLRKKGMLGLFDSVKTAGTNQARERLVRSWQEKFVQEELSN